MKIIKNLRLVTILAKTKFLENKDILYIEHNQKNLIELDSQSSSSDEKEEHEDCHEECGEDMDENDRKISDAKKKRKWKKRRSISDELNQIKLI